MTKDEEIDDLRTKLAQLRDSYDAMRKADQAARMKAAGEHAITIDRLKSDHAAATRALHERIGQLEVMAGTRQKCTDLLQIYVEWPRQLARDIRAATGMRLLLVVSVPEMFFSQIFAKVGSIRRSTDVHGMEPEYLMVDDSVMLKRS